MPFELRVALRYLTGRRKQAFSSVISGVAVMGVAGGVMAVLIALGLMTGLQSEIRAGTKVGGNRGASLGCGKTQTRGRE